MKKSRYQKKKKRRDDAAGSVSFVPLHPFQHNEKKKKSLDASVALSLFSAAVLFLL